MVTVTGTIKSSLMTLGAGTLMIIIRNCCRAMMKDAADWLRNIEQSGRLLLWMGFGAATKNTELCERSVPIAIRGKCMLADIEAPDRSGATARADDEGSYMMTLAGQFSKLDAPNIRLQISNNTSSKIAAESLPIFADNGLPALTDRSGTHTQRLTALFDRSGAVRPRELSHV